MKPGKNGGDWFMDPEARVLPAESMLIYNRMNWDVIQQQQQEIGFIERLSHWKDVAIPEI